MGSHRRKKGAAPVRTGLLGVSAAVALGAVAVTTGLVPADGLHLTGGPSDQVRADRTPADPGAPLTVSTPPWAQDTGTGPASPSASPSPSRTSAKPKPTPTPTHTKTVKPSPSKTAAPHRTTPAPTTAAPKTAAPTTAAPTGGSAEAQVLALVNQERASAGCRPLVQDPQLASLAEAFSKDMAARNFFDHTDPDGDTPWDRADQAGIKDMGGENIARGQATAESVMDAWMNSSGHRANILNCEFRTLGVGAYFADGGPWWTQDFGY